MYCSTGITKQHDLQLIGRVYILFVCSNDDVKCVVIIIYLYVRVWEVIDSIYVKTVIRLTTSTTKHTLMRGRKCWEAA